MGAVHWPIIPGDFYPLTTLVPEGKSQRPSLYNPHRVQTSSLHVFLSVE